MDLDEFLRLIYIGNEKLIIITNRKKFIANYCKIRQNATDSDAENSRNYTFAIIRMIVK